mmetsp:Transcript_58153/g.115418  ORF Transcript_58153/g.115418 Transcript_58153/m.115418 type:complete len:222 (+) Transcript_58153:643-1308(+)
MLQAAWCRLPLPLPRAAQPHTPLLQVLLRHATAPSQLQVLTSFPCSGVAHLDECIQGDPWPCRLVHGHAQVLALPCSVKSVCVSVMSWLGLGRLSRHRGARRGSLSLLSTFCRCWPRTPHTSCKPKHHPDIQKGLILVLGEQDAQWLILLITTRCLRQAQYIAVSHSSRAQRAIQPHAAPSPQPASLQTQSLARCRQQPCSDWQIQPTRAAWHGGRGCERR